MTCRLAAALLILAGACGVASPAQGQDLGCEPGDVEVRGLDFIGNRAFTSAELANVIVTTPSSFGRRMFNLPFSPRRCLVPGALANDRLRLLIFYRKRGFPRVTVDTASLAAGRNGVRVHFLIREGPPSVLTSLAVTGLDSVARAARLVRDLAVKAGTRFDRVRMDAARAALERRLRNSGYPDAVVVNDFETDSSGLVAADTLAVATGPFTRVGGVQVSVTPAPDHGQEIPNAVVSRLTGLRRGDVYREQALVDAQRALFQTNAYAHVAISLDSARGRRVGGDSLVGISVAAVENPMLGVRAGVGYGTLDCFRATSQLDNYNFLHTARKLELTGRVSKIGVGRPLAGAAGLCPQAQQDPYSGRLNYYLGGTLAQPVYPGARTLPTLTVYSQRVSEYRAYLRTTAVGAVASLSWRRFRSAPVIFSYALDYGRTEAQPALFCAVFNLCAREDRARVQSTQRLAVVSAVAVRDWSNNLLSPSSGGVLRLEARHSSPVVGSQKGLQFNKLLGEVARYTAVGNGTVLAMRLRGGAVVGGSFGATTGFVPPQERLYAGGATTVRGFAQNELGSVTYIAALDSTGAAYDTVSPPASGSADTYFRARSSVRTFRRAVPVGGNSMVVGNLELRLRSPILPEVLQPTLFVDAGDVWNRGLGSAFQGFRIKVTPGVQLGALTPVGPVRVVLGYNPYARPPGSLYYEGSAAGGTLPCVSPGNTLPVRSVNGALVQDEGRCNASFTPVGERGFRSRLTFALAIGQAF